MPDYETSAERYSRLARECLETANTFPSGEPREALIQMAQVWQRLADQYDEATPSLHPSGMAAEQPAMQQQQQVQPDEDEAAVTRKKKPR